MIAGKFVSIPERKRNRCCPFWVLREVEAEASTFSAFTCNEDHLADKLDTFVSGFPTMEKAHTAAGNTGLKVVFIIDQAAGRLHVIWTLTCC